MKSAPGFPWHLERTEVFRGEGDSKLDVGISEGMSHGM